MIYLILLSADVPIHRRFVEPSPSCSNNYKFVRCKTLAAFKDV